MTDQPPVPPLPPRPRPAGPSAGDAVAVLLTVIWLGLVGAFLLFGNSPATGSGGVALALTLVAIVLPVVLIWVVAVTARTARTLREEAAALQAALDSMRQAYVAQAQAQAAILRAPAPRAPAPPPAAVPAPAEDAGTDQPSLALGTRAEDRPDPLTPADLIRAFNFPDSPSDRDGFRAMRRALENRETARLIRAAQDVLTLLSQDGIYMDDLTPDRARPEIWRRFAQGERGRAIAALGGVRDRSSLALTAARMRQDTIFRDAAHHFLRQFDRSFAAFAQSATDLEIASLADTRTARAFMLLGRVTGIFD
ncbi:MAG: hypothetical protein N2422_04045 [Rhodobacteraceae bacterium]|nr:hypothetical protein [Paracoccaceae bacterium]